MNETLTIFHNPRCSKSRQTLAILEEADISPHIILYLNTPPNAQELKIILTKLGMTPRQLLRTGEEAYKTLQLADKNLTDDDIIEAMTTHPKLIERPIVVKGDRAVIGRPPENVNSLIKQ